MENKILSRGKNTEYNFEHWIDIPLQKLKDIITYAESIGDNYFQVYANKDWDGDVESIQFETVRLFTETDEEVKIRKEKEEIERISAEKTRKEQIEAQELTQYLKLKEKYDGKI
jgi:hypothetical protein